MNWFSLAVSLIIICTPSAITVKNNVCKTLLDYYTDRDANPNCYYNPTINYEIPDIVRYNGYICESYTVQTEDGYILELFRVLNRKNFQNPGPPVLVEHGFGGNAVIWCNVGKNSLAYVLSDAGYDVWLGNLRGCMYSNKHVSLNRFQREYWNFSFTEMGLFDIPAQLNLINEITKQKIFFIGYSMSTSSFFVYSSAFPEEAKSKVRVSINLSALGYIGSPWFYLKAISQLIRIPLVDWAIENVFSENGSVDQRTSLFLLYLKLVCLPYPHTMIACLLSSDYTGGLDLTQFNPETLPIVTYQNYDGGSSKSLIHVTQLMESGRFQDYDYGRVKNMRMYGSKKPPIFNLTKITVPNFFVHPHNDPISSKKNVETTLSLLQPAAKPFDVYVIKDKLFSHVDISYGRDARPLVYDVIVDFLNVNGSKCN